MNTSATGGYLLPDVPSPPLEGKALLQFLQAVVVGITGMDGTLVRPRWQAEPPNIPAADVAWCSFGIMGRSADTFPYVKHFGEDDINGGYDYLMRHEQLELLTSFYDLGVSGEADYYASILRDGLAIAQNREALYLGGFVLAYTGDLTPVPTLLKERWLYRIDFPFTLRRQIDRKYSVLNILSFQGTLDAGTYGTNTPIGQFIIGESPIGPFIQLIDDLLVTPPVP